MKDSAYQPVTRGILLYGTVTYTPGRGWVGIKAGEFYTAVRVGFDTQAAAQLWVLSNPHPQVADNTGAAS